MAYRTIKKVVTGMRTQDGAGVSLVRVISRPDVELFDPFLLLDAFDSHNPDDYVKGFPWHPHRGIETITYLIKGKIEHGDSIGNKGVIYDGSSQWMTAGSGILHQEMPLPSEHMLGVQIWLNLPEKDKMCPPKYRDILPQNIGHYKDDVCDVAVISGKYKDVLGAVEPDYVKITFLDITLYPQADFEMSIPSTETLYIYIVEGNGQVMADERVMIHEKSGVLFGEGDKIKVSSLETPMRFFLLSGQPLKESIAWGGPIVMNTREQLNLAFDELEKGTFLK